LTGEATIPARIHDAAKFPEFKVECGDGDWDKADAETQWKRCHYPGSRRNPVKDNNSAGRA